METRGRATSMSSARYLTYATIVSIYSLMTVGAYLTVNPGFGLACPDWPLCHGQVIPRLYGAVLIEYSHRLLSVLTTLLLLASTIAVWRMPSRPARALPALLLAVGLLIFQILLGAVVVSSELNAIVTTMHLAVATATFGSVVVAATVLQGSSRQT